MITDHLISDLRSLISDLRSLKISDLRSLIISGLRSLISDLTLRILLLISDLKISYLR